MNEIIQGNCLSELKKLEDKSVNCCVTSPPYWGLRDYGHDDQLGLEKTPQEYVEKIVQIFREVKRVLKDDGTLWLNLGDSYVNHSQPGGGDPTIKRRNIGKSTYTPTKVTGLKPKDLVGMPWMVAFALRADGWYLRQDIIWQKPNPMPESVTDRCTKSHEYIFLMSKSKKYYYDQESIKEDTITNDTSLRNRDDTRLNNTPGRARMGGLVSNNYEQRNKRSVWTVATKPFKEAHFATFPQELIIDCIKAGCPEDGVVLDPFMGGGTTALVSRKLNRNYIGFELNESYIKIANERLFSELGMFL